MVDEELPFGKEGGRKSWYLTITQDRDLLKELGPVQGAPKKGKTLLLFEDDVVALTEYVARNNLVMFDEHGRLVLDDHGRLVNGPAWEYEEMRQLQRKRKVSKRKSIKAPPLTRYPDPA